MIGQGGAVRFGAKVLMLVLGGLVCRDRWGGECWLESPSFSTFFRAGVPGRNLEALSESS